MAKSLNTKDELNISVNLISEEKKRISVLRQQMRDTAKEIKQLESTTRRDAGISEWKAISDLKQQFIAELHSHPRFKRMSWKRFNETPDYFIYARNAGAYTHYAIDDTAEWVKKAVKAGTSLVELEANANGMRVKRWNNEQRRQRAASKKEKDAANKAALAAAMANKKKEKSTDEDRFGKGKLEDQLGNG